MYTITAVQNGWTVRTDRFDRGLEEPFYVFNDFQDMCDFLEEHSIPKGVK